jgi:hypothetical protein
MTLDEVKKEVGKYVYMENTSMIDASLATIIANRMSDGVPVWLVIVGASSGGKSQILKPLALSDENYMHRVDDLTESTFLSGSPDAKGSSKKGGKKDEEDDDSFDPKKSKSLLLRIGSHGMIVISDLTVLFSRGVESRNAILSQFRMLYDGEMVKSVGTMSVTLRWKGHLGIIAGSTPTIYQHMEEVSDMGERFMYWRMHEYDERKATKVAMGRKLQGSALDEKLSGIYAGYIKEVVQSGVRATLTESETDDIINIAVLAEKIRTSVKRDRFSKKVEHIPSPAFPMRTALQLRNVAEALALMYGGSLGLQGMQVIRWMGWSLANEEKRRCLQFLAGQAYAVRTATVADAMGLDTEVVRNILQAMATVGILQRDADSSEHTWKIREAEDKKLICEILENNVDAEVTKERDIVSDDKSRPSYEDIEAGEF